MEGSLPVAAAHRLKGTEFLQNERSVMLFIGHFVFTDEGKFRIDSFQFIASSSLYGIFIASRERKQRKGKGGRAGVGKGEVLQLGVCRRGKGELVSCLKVIAS
jgi:hypothetical protein